MIDHRRPSFIQFSKPNKRSLAAEDKYTQPRPDDPPDDPPDDDDDTDSFYSALDDPDLSSDVFWATPCWTDSKAD